MKYNINSGVKSLLSKNFVIGLLALVFLAGTAMPVFAFNDQKANAAPVKGGNKWLGFYGDEPSTIEAGTGKTSFGVKSRVNLYKLIEENEPGLLWILKLLGINPNWTNEIALGGGATIRVSTSDGLIASSCDAEDWSTSHEVNIKPSEIRLFKITLEEIQSSFCYKSDVAGENTIHAESVNKDDRGNEASRSTFSFPINVIDTTKPVIEIVSPKKDSIVGSTYTIKAKLTDVGSGISHAEAFFALEDNLQIQTKKTLMKLEDPSNNIYGATINTEGHNGIYRAAVDAWDKSGNSSSGANLNILVDSIAPKAEVKPESVSFDRKVFSSISYKLSDNNKVGGFYVNGKDNPLTPSKLSDANDIKVGSWQGAKYGKNTLTVYDLAGNETSYDFYLDNKKPEVAITGAQQKNKTLKFSGYVKDDNFRHYYCFLTKKEGGGEIKGTRGDNCVTTWAKDLQRNGNPATSTNQGGGSSENPVELGSFNVSNLESGEYTIHLVALDRAKNESNKFKYDVTIDNQSPQANFTITPPRYVKENFQVQAVASDNIALKDAFFDVRDDSGWVAGCVSGSLEKNFINERKNAEISCTINTSKLTEGKTYTLRIHANDFAGYGGGQSSELILDLTKPKITDLELSNDRIKAGDTNPTINGVVNDSNGKVRNAQFKVFDPANPDKALIGWTELNPKDGSFDSDSEEIEGSIDVSGLGDGEYIVRVRAFDMAENKRSGADLRLIIDRTAPKWASEAVHIFPDNELELDLNDPVTVQWEDATDPNGVTYYFESSTLSETTGDDNAFTHPIPGGTFGPLDVSEFHDIVDKAGIYFWHVKACDDLGNCTPWSAPWTVTVKLNGSVLGDSDQDNKTKAAKPSSRNALTRIMASAQDQGENSQNNTNTTNTEPANTEPANDQADEPSEDNSEEVAAATTDNASNPEEQVASAAVSDGSFMPSWLWVLLAVGAVGSGAYYYAYARREQ